ncbi:hypothetical protein BT93_B0599 [Corymbia citriodora subsp. variegata]|nr:hypothetical protein BT93_B0599 [Corymbia citriodora subsp. variegata]
MAGYGYGGQYGAGGGYPPPAQPYGNPFAALTPSSFPPGTDPNMVACFQMADQDGSGLVDDRELQRALSSYNQGFTFSWPREFTGLFNCIQLWKGTFERFDRDMSGKIDGPELRESLLSMGFLVPPVVVDLLVNKYDKYGDGSRAIEYDNFIECCLIVKGLTERFKERDTMLSGSATFTYEAFMLAVLPFLVA